jgi:hypothetical protein
VNSGCDADLLQARIAHHENPEHMNVTRSVSFAASIFREIAVFFIPFGLKAPAPIPCHLCPSPIPSLQA